MRKRNERIVFLVVGVAKCWFQFPKKQERRGFQDLLYFIYFLSFVVDKKLGIRLQLYGISGSGQIGNEKDKVTEKVDHLEQTRETD